MYDLSQAVEDGATVRVYYEARLAKVELPEEARTVLDAEFDEVTELAETETRERMKTRWARVEAVVGAEKRIGEVAADIVEHWETPTQRAHWQGADRVHEPADLHRPLQRDREATPGLALRRRRRREDQGRHHRVGRRRARVRPTCTQQAGTP